MLLMKQNYSFYLNCPVRGQLTGFFGTEFSEEYRRIECVQFLIDKKYRTLVLKKK